METPEDCRDELWRGEVVYIPFQTGREGTIRANVLGALADLTRERPDLRPRGRCGYVVGREPDAVLAPAASVRLPEAGVPHVAAWELGAPEFVCEVSSNGINDWMDERLEAYLASGARRVWVVDPEAESVTVYRNDGRHRVYAGADVLTDDDAALGTTGFSLPAREIFD